MKDKTAPIDIQRQRRDNYCSHFESRQQVKAMEEDQVTRLKNIAEVMRSPKLNGFGCDDYTENEWKQIIDLANNSGVPAALCLKWYHSDREWDNFLVKWNNLPEVGREVFQILVERKPSTTPVENPVQPVDKTPSYPHLPQPRTV